MFFEVITGSLPFRGDTSFAVLRSHCDTPPPVPSSLKYTLPAALDIENKEIGDAVCDVVAD